MQRTHFIINVRTINREVAISLKDGPKIVEWWKQDVSALELKNVQLTFGMNGIQAYLSGSCEFDVNEFPTFDNKVAELRHLADIDEDGNYPIVIDHKETLLTGDLISVDGVNVEEK